MKPKTFASFATTALAAAFAGAAAIGQPTTGTVELHMAMAKVAAGDDNQRLYQALCEQPAAGPNTGGAPPDPERSAGTSSRSRCSTISTSLVRRNILPGR
jgi:hypothetical protein